jgi:hypothetical protein
MLSDGIEPNTQTKEILIALAKDDIANSIIDSIAAGGWTREAILTNSVLTSPAKGTTPSLQDCMRLMMREMKMSDEDIKRRCEMLSAEVDMRKRK